MWLLVAALVCPAACLPQLSCSVVAGACVHEIYIDTNAHVTSTTRALTSVTTSLAMGPDGNNCDPYTEAVQISRAITNATFVSAALHWEAPLSASAFQNMPVFTANSWKWGVYVGADF